jgi:hypothetical protein
MFGSYAIVLGLQSNQTISKTGQGYLGQRWVPKDTSRSLSLAGVLKKVRTDTLGLDCYHNPFADVAADSHLVAKLADAPYIHPNPHNRGFVPWEPKRIET